MHSRGGQKGRRARRKRGGDGSFIVTDARAALIACVAIFPGLCVFLEHVYYSG